MNKQIKDYIIYILAKIRDNIMMKNNAYETGIGDGDIELLFQKIFDELDGFPKDYFDIVFQPILKDK